MESKEYNSGCLTFCVLLFIIGVVISFTGVGAIAGIPMALVALFLRRIAIEGVRKATIIGGLKIILAIIGAVLFIGLFVLIAIAITVNSGG